MGLPHFRLFQILVDEKRDDMPPWKIEKILFSLVFFNSLFSFPAWLLCGELRFPLPLLLFVIPLPWQSAILMFEFRKLEDSAEVERLFRSLRSLPPHLELVRFFWEISWRSESKLFLNSEYSRSVSSLSNSEVPLNTQHSQTSSYPFILVWNMAARLSIDVSS